MFTQDSTSLILVCGWSLAAVGVGLLCGFFIGRFYTQQNESKKLKQERENTLTALLKLMQSTNQLNVDVDEHNTSLATAKEELQSLSEGGDTIGLQRELISNITRVVKSNRRLENDLVVSQYKLESQAQELDRSRIEARTDSLCAIGNRKAVDERLRFMVSRFQSDGSSFGLMLVDVDHFKRVNDTFGHPAGDKILSNIALVLKECVRPEDFVGRLGGDEFAIMFDSLTAETADMVGARVRKSIERHDFGADGQSTVVTLSMGLAIVGRNDDPPSLYARADRALYRSKELGRNRLFTLLEEENEIDSAENFEAEDDAPAAKSSSYESFKSSFAKEA